MRRTFWSPPQPPRLRSQMMRCLRARAARCLRRWKCPSPDLLWLLALTVLGDRSCLAAASSTEAGSAAGPTAAAFASGGAAQATKVRGRSAFHMEKARTRSPTAPPLWVSSSRACARAGASWRTAPAPSGTMAAFSMVVRMVRARSCGQMARDTRDSLFRVPAKVKGASSFSTAAARRAPSSLACSTARGGSSDTPGARARATQDSGCKANATAMEPRAIPMGRGTWVSSDAGRNTAEENCWML
mmetsp:Transcript_2991/g.11537  ORF Transcript_2991/g.11537 Transcript_2991/m.11537 type:complete len:244 (+) Transcript_2991:318-1049(+)